MTRSPLAYPLNRSADTDVGGAADLQTDIMRFMAILSLCLVAIFALVQSIPLTPTEPSTLETPEPEAIPEPLPVPKPPTDSAPQPVREAQPGHLTDQHRQPAGEMIKLTRPKWVPKYEPRATTAVTIAEATPPPATPPLATPQPLPEPQPVAAAEKEGFTLRFESDAALTRAVAASHVGLYAIQSDRALRMTVSDSRISFWDASTPNTFHEMETATVPAAVIDALGRTGVRAEAVSWGVTLPGKMKSQLDALMQSNSGGSLIIGAGGDIRLEAT